MKGHSMEELKTLYREAMKNFRENKLNEAIGNLEKAIEIDPGFANGLEALGEMYQRAQRLDDAIRVLQRFCEIAPDEVMGHTNLSRLYQKKGMIKEAEDEQAKARLLSMKK
ncbi:MAG: tetratricopeptide repeat protein [Nitrospirae bacterium]|nr:tetratricopeptide repeat protein [Nitrospirota bacterium]